MTTVIEIDPRIEGLSGLLWRSEVHSSGLARTQIPATTPMKPLGQLEDIARRSLERNVHNFPGGCYLAAGAHQFNSLWTRDFCFSSRGLFRLSKLEVVHDQLELILANLQTRDGFAIAPKVMDVSSAIRQCRCVSAVINKYFGRSPSVPLNPPMKAEYEDEQGSIAIDSNLLILLTAYDYFARASADDWWKRRLQDLVRLYRYYDRKHAKDVDGLIVQPPFSDWQDSARRTGKAFYTNLLYYLVSRRFGRIP